MDNQTLSLFQLLVQVKSALKKAMPVSYWILAEISEMKVNYSGHCYLELVEKEETGESIRAKARATIWSAVYRMLQPYFETTTQTRLSAGIRVMVKVTAEFHEMYGFSLNISDIEPSYTLGELAKQKLEIINRLKAEGVYDMNRALRLPELPRRIAVISSRTAAGYGDFMDQLTGNPYGYKFYLKIYPAVMQGDEAEQSIIGALDRIYDHEDFFDAVVIIRGGGAQSELSCFNGYWLTSHICQFPLPVLTGIGHEQDETIADLVANTRLKTPTAVAEFLIDRFRGADMRINELSSSLVDAVTEQVHEEQELLNRFLLLLRPSVRERMVSRSVSLRYLSVHITGAVKQRLIKETGSVNRRNDKLKIAAREFMNQRKHTLDILDKKNGYLDPFLILKRGYSITYHKGKAIKDPALVSPDEIIETRLAGGILISKTT